MTRSYDEYKEILELWALGHNKKQIGRMTGIPRATVRDCIARFETLENLDTQTQETKRRFDPETWTPDYRSTYAYMLAAYLGDGHISKMPRTYRLRLFMDSRYTNIIQTCVSALETLLPENKPYVMKRLHANCVEIVSHSNQWIHLLPQHGAGRKHERKIELEPWQQAIADEYPMEMLRGFIHTDGSRFEPVIYNRVYARYQFTNLSEDIKALFRRACTKVGITWTEWGVNLVIAKRPHVELLDREIGPKS
jgi:hypothetical protein